MRLILGSSQDGRVGSCDRRIIGRIDVETTPAGPARLGTDGVKDRDGRSAAGSKLLDRRTVQHCS